MTIKSKLVHSQNVSILPYIISCNSRCSVGFPSPNKMCKISYSSFPIPQVIQQAPTTAGDLFPHMLKSDTNSSLTKLAGGNNERQWEVGGEFPSVNLALALGVKVTPQKYFKVVITVLIHLLNVY